MPKRSQRNIENRPKKTVRKPILSSRNGFDTLGGMKTTCFSVVGIVAFLCLVTQTSTATSLQYRSNNFVSETDSATWPSVDGSLSLTSVHAATNGWVLPEKDGRAIFFGNSVTSPLGFPDSATNTTAYVLAVVENVIPSDLATLIDAPCSIRFLPNPFNDDWFLSESQLTNAVNLLIDGIDTNSFSSADSPRLIEASLDVPCRLNELYIGGTPATPSWNQNWSGGISELILLAEHPTDRQRNALCRYLSLKYGLNLKTASDVSIASVLTTLGINAGGTFNSVLLVR